MPEERSRVQITLPPVVLERLDVMAAELGLKRSSVIALLINERWRQDHAAENK